MSFSLSISGKASDPDIELRIEELAVRLVRSCRENGIEGLSVKGSFRGHSVDPKVFGFDPPDPEPVPGEDEDGEPSDAVIEVPTGAAIGIGVPPKEAKA